MPDLSRLIASASDGGAYYRFAPWPAQLTFRQIGLLLLHRVMSELQSIPAQLFAGCFMKSSRYVALSVLFILLPLANAWGQSGQTKLDYQNPTLPTERRVQDLL